jgi:hypothetical protein
MTNQDFAEGMREIEAEIKGYQRQNRAAAKPLNPTEWNGTPYGYLHPQWEGYNVPQWFIDNAEDQSWKNDAAPSFRYDNQIRGGFRIYVDAEEPALSEFGRGANGRYMRFAVYDVIDECETGDLLEEFETLGEVVAYLTSEDPNL